MKIIIKYLYLGIIIALIPAITSCDMLFEPKGILNMGMNISGVSYYHSRNLMFNDVMKTKHEIGTASYLQGGYTGKLDENGYPVEVIKGSNPYFDGGAPTILINDVYEGDYIFLYDGEGELEFHEGMTVVSEENNKIYLKLTKCEKTSENDPHRRIVIRESLKGNNLRNFRLIPKEFENKEDKMPLFNKDFLNGLKDMQVLRFMDALNTNSTNLVHFADRPKVTDWSYDIQGLPLEILIELANTLKMDAWFNVPHKASDDFIKKMASLIESTLDKSLKAYIEYSNEIWHEGFPQGKWINNPSDTVDSYIIEDIKNLKSPKYKSDNRHLKNAYFMSRTFRIFQDVFTGDKRSRLVTVGTYYFWEYPLEIIDYLIENNTKPDVVAGSGYFNFTKEYHEKWMIDPDSVTADDIIDSIYELWDTEITPGMSNFAQMVNSYDIDYIVYEGGQHMQPFNQGNHPYNNSVYEAQISPRMYDLYMKNFQFHQSLDCKLFINFSYVSQRESQYGSWGVLENLSDINKPNLKGIAPKYQAILDASIKK